MMPVPIPEGAQIGEPQQASGGSVPIPQGAQVGEPQDQGDYLTKTEDVIGKVAGTVGQDISEVGKSLAGAVSDPAPHLLRATQSLVQGDLLEAGRSFLQAIKVGAPGKMLDAQLQSSKQAGQRMIEAGKKGDALGVAQHAAGVIPGASQVDAAMTAYQENPSTEGLTRVLENALAILIPGGMKLRGAMRGAAAGAGEEAVTAAETAPKVSKPGIVKQVVKGEKVAQEPAQAAMREAAGGSTGSLRESLAVPIADSEAKASALYKQIDETAGVDVKALNRKLQNTNRQLRQLTDTPEDQAMEARLEQSRTGIMDKLEEAGVDPKLMQQADAAYRQARALSDVDAKVFKNPDIVEGNEKFGTTETVNVDKAIKALERLQGSKYGARVEQAFGKEGANELMSKLYGAQRQGVHALKMQQVAKWIAGIIGAGAVAKGAGVLSGVSGEH